MVKRPMKVRAKFQDRNGEWYEIEAEELLARCIMHETDHLDGQLYVDIKSRELFDEDDGEETEEMCIRDRHAGGRMACGALSGRLRRGQTARRGGSGRPRGAAAAHGGCLRPRRAGHEKKRDLPGKAA